MSPYKTPVCVSCLVKLTWAEQEFYECRCEKCERKWHERIQAWKAGRPDAELDQMFKGEYALSPLLGKTVRKR